MTDLVGQTLGRFHLVRHVATGGMAEIYLATYAGPGGFVRKCVVKRLHASQLQNEQAQAMFFTEARVLASLQHPNIVQVIDFCHENNEYVLAMEFVDGASLLQLMKAARKINLPLGIAVAVSIGLGVSRALAYAHSAKGPDDQPLKLVHRDVTPGNILVSRAGDVKLVDFGVAKVRNAAHATEAGMIKGKFAYMSPEQISAGELDGRSDIFSLGVVLWEIATATRLFKRADVAQELFAVAQAQVRSPREIDPTIPHDFERIVMRCLAKAPEDRYPSASALCAALTEYRDNWELPAGEELLSRAMAATFSEMEEAPVLRPAGESTSGGAQVRSMESFTIRAQPGTEHSNRVLIVALVTVACLMVTLWLWVLLLR